MNERDDCLHSWIKQNWSLTNSLETPLGPVFDQRWEDFEELGSFNAEYNPINLESATFAFSVRASLSDVEMLFCNGSDYTKSFCYWIIIGGWNNSKSAIRRCPIGAPKPNMEAEDKECSIDKASAIHAPLSSTEWRTFLVIWDIINRNISLYDSTTDTVFMRYQDTKLQTSETENRKVKNSDFFNYYHMFIRSADMMIYRFHVYSFLHTTIANATLTSPTFQFNNKMCIQLLLGLCAECEMSIILYDRTGNIELKRGLVKRFFKATSHDLPTWQYITIKYTTNNYDSVKMKLTPKLNSYSSNPLWAVANIRRCPTNASLRWSRLHSIIPSIVWNKFPSVTCQKLFYDKHTVVNTTPDATSNVKMGDAECPEGKIGPQCLLHCNSDLYGYAGCKGHVICYKEGCTCPPVCETNKYGYYCKQKCGSCKNSTPSSRDLCNKVTGDCLDGCHNSQETVYVPSLCRTSILHTIIYNIFSFSGQLCDISLSLSLSLSLLQDTSNNGILWRPVFSNGTELIEHFTNLESGTIYNIRCLLRACNQYGLMCSYSMQSEYQEAETTCHRKFKFNVILIFLLQYQQLFPCPANRYELIIQRTDTGSVVLSAAISKFPYKVPYNLSSYTLFNVTILDKYQKIFSQKIRTFEKAPSTVLNFISMNVSDTNVTLSWMAPTQPNGIIEGYNVELQVIKYLGCKDSTSDLSSIKTTHQTKNTTITIHNLHPYASYRAQIVAYNARFDSEVAETIFNTSKSDVATEVFSQLKAQGWNLTWKPPEDCTTITGPLDAKIKIRSIKDDSENFPIVKYTKYTYLPLYKAELYALNQFVARVYVIRAINAAENPSAYQEIEFAVPPGVPPQVTKLDVYEIDKHQDPMVVYLRWQKPIPPLNGTLRGYSIRLCNNVHVCSYTEVPLTNTCKLWDDYVCGSVHLHNIILQVVAYNMDVHEPGPPVIIPQKIFDKNLYHDSLNLNLHPANFIVVTLNNGIVDLYWNHPWKTGYTLKYFGIKITEVFTNLFKRFAFLKENAKAENDIIIVVSNYTRTYSKRVYLHPSTKYSIIIRAYTVPYLNGRTSYKQIETPSSLKFDGPLKYIINDSTILLMIPPVKNYTINSIIHIIVKGPLGPKGCKGYLKVPENLQALAGVNVSHIAWEAANFPIEEAGKVFAIGDNKMYGKAKNCQVQPKELYDITVIVSEYNQILITNHIQFDVIRKRHRTIKTLMLQDEIALSQNIENYEHETKSAISSSKESLSTPPDRQSLSRATTPEVPLTAIKNTDDIKEMTSLVKVKDFEDYVREAIQAGSLVKQYETFPRGQTQPWDYGKLPQNKSKNRYGNLIAYDETRVVLEKLPGDSYSDYINANFITGYKKEKHYIATQGPKPNTVIDFWRMIWQENVLIICMLANVVENGKTKCEQYWPDIGKKKKYGNIIVLNAKHNVFADYCFRTFQITCGKETRKVEHLHYTAWPDHGVPLYTQSVVTYLKKLLATPSGNGSVVVHCSAGVGRTGTIILCDICLRRAAAEGVVDVYAETASIRSERANMVDNKQQYLLAHLAVMECLLSIPTTLPCNEMLVTRITEMKKQLPVQQQRLENTAWQDEALRQVTSPPPLSERNRAKNRFPELISDKISRIYLKRYPATDEDSDYLSAVYVDGVKLQNHYLATQLPMPSTINDFWRMIAEFKVELILMLQPPDLQDPTCCAIAPASGEFKPTPYLNITAKETVELENYTSQKLLLLDNSEKPSKERSVTILCLTQWKPGRNQSPPPVMTMVTLWQAAERIARGDGPTVTLCHDGVTGCGLYLALSFLLERMAVERECDVCLAVRAIRRSRPDFVRSLEHLEYLYDAAVTYLEYFETYANFS
ncbi:Receptor-type tyrosine-protein phosphatase kappa [Ooceraea biroi]|uniref:protein-tyrosine-phosphatase n=1 Tax=Ooceraea biroi TaxID=2015173 RepID=A0A026VXC3_OOCBI|nr:Receptor-type tyrosine-protein phosphatase kappa [Ooceraea biroi]